MAQKIKYNTGTTTSECCVRKGNFEVGIVPTYPYGPTREKGFWAGYDVPIGGFVSYQRKDTQGPSIYQLPNLSSVVSYGQNLDLGRTLSTPTDVIQACSETDDIMFVNFEYPNIPLIQNCVLLMDAGYTASYPWGGSNWYDVSGAQQVTGGTVDVTTTFTGGTPDSSYSNSYLNYQNTIGTNVPAFGSTIETFTVNIIFNTSGVSASQNINLIGQRYSQDSGYTPENDCNFLIRGGNNANEVEGLFRVGGVDYSTGAVNISGFSDTWIGLTLTYNGTDLTLYVNGESEVSTIPGVTPVSNGLETLIAGSVNGLAPGTSSDYFNGDINLVQIYNTALNSTQIQELYNGYSSRIVNFDVENVDWSSYGVTGKSSFISYILSNSNYTSVNVSYFEYTTTRIRATIVATGGTNLNLRSSGIVNITLIGGGFNNITILDLSSNQIVTFDPLPLPDSLLSLVLVSNDIPEFNPTYPLPPNLETLWLSGNQIVTFDPSLPLPNTLINLLIAYNNIVTFDPSLPLPTGLRTLDVSNNQIVTFDPTISLPSGLTSLLVGFNDIVTFDPTISLPISLVTLSLQRNQIVTFFPSLPLPTSLENLELNFNVMTTAGYTASEPWANNQPSFTNNCNIRFNNNINSVTGTNLESILLTKNATIFA
jgi:Leucine-rich repeat (LRR) protein